MQVATITGPRQGGVVEVPDPHPHGEFVVVKVHAVPMCTEFKAFREGHQSQCLGHEAAGEVVAVDCSNRVQVGDRVVVQPQYPCGKCALCEAGNYIHCQHCHDVLAETGNTTGTATYAQYLLKNDWLLTPIPDGISYEHAGMAVCGLGPTFGAMQLMHVDAFDTVLITGLGPVGLGGVINGVFRGARVIGVESHPYRANLARELGAVAVINPQDADAADQVRALTGGLGADKAIETSGVAAAKTFLADAIRRKGQIAFVGWEGSIEAGTVIQKGLTVHGAWHYNLYDAGKLMGIIGQVGPQLDKLITHRFPMREVQQAWETQVSGNCGKIVLDPWG